jgi:hypothetical protein
MYIKDVWLYDDDIYVWKYILHISLKYIYVWIYSYQCLYIYIVYMNECHNSSEYWYIYICIYMWIL